MRDLSSPDQKTAQHAFDTLFREHYAHLVRFATTIVHTTDTAEEIVQETFVALWQRRMSLVIRDDISPYLFGAVRRNALAYLRHQRVVEGATYTAEAIGEPLGMGASPLRPEHQLELDELTTALDAIIATLPEHQRSAFLLRWRYELSYKEIGEGMGISPDAARVQIDRVERKLARLLEGYRP